MDKSRNGKDEFSKLRLPGAQFFDINEVADTSSDLPHMFPGASLQRAAAAHFGLQVGRQVVVYEAGPLFAAPRAWWTLKHMGYDARILNGGMQAWISAGESVVSTPVIPGALKVQQEFALSGDPSSPPDGVLDFERVQKLSALLDGEQKQCNSDNGGTLYILDARAAGRFNGTSPEPREGIQSGHMPGSTNVPFASLLEASDGTLLPMESLQTAFRRAGVSLHNDATYITTCGSGVTAAVILLALHECGVPWKSLNLYDGSWLDWATRGGKIIR